WRTARSSGLAISAGGVTPDARASSQAASWATRLRSPGSSADGPVTAQLQLQPFDGPCPEHPGGVRGAPQPPADLLERQSLLVAQRRDPLVVVRQPADGGVQTRQLLIGHD